MRLEAGGSIHHILFNKFTNMSDKVRFLAANELWVRKRYKVSSFTPCSIIFFVCYISFFQNELSRNTFRASISLGPFQVRSFVGQTVFKRYQQTSQRVAVKK